MIRDVRLKDIAQINRRVLPESTPGDVTFRYVDIGAVTQGSVQIPEGDVSFASAPSRARRLAETGDTLVSTVRTYLRAVAPVPLSDLPLVFSTGFAVLHPGPAIEPRFLSYYCQSKTFIEEVVARSVGVSYPAINASEIGYFRLGVPTLDEQRRIATFLDAQTANIDRLIDLRRRQMGLIEERLQAKLEREIAPHIGAPWKLSRLTLLLRDGSHNPPPRVIEGVRLLTAKNVRGNRLRISTDDTFVSHTDADLLDRSLRAVPGDILLSIKGTVGSVAVVPEGFERFVFERNLALLRPNARLCTSEWLHLAIRTACVQDQIQLGTTFSAQPGIYLGALAALQIPLASLDDQASIVARHAERESHAAQATSLGQRSVALLREHRDSLITAAVTGRLDVITARGAVW